MAKRVKSIKQSGGVTAETVNIENAENIGAHAQRSSAWRWVFRAAAVAAIVAVVIAVVQLFGEGS